MNCLQPYRFARQGRDVRNRCVLAAMTNKQSHDDGSLSQDELRWLQARASGGFGIITTCAAHVSLDGQGWDRELGIFDDALLPGLRQLADALRAEGSLSLVQLYHGGVRSPSRLTGQQPISASVFSMEQKNFEEPRAASEAEIERIIRDFGRAAQRASEAGFDGVEIHGAHGYLLTQFLGTVTNTREDQWGGNPENRARLIRRVLAECKAATPADFIVGVRMSPEIAEQGVDFDEARILSRRLSEDGADFVHVSNWESFRPPSKYPDSERMLTEWFRESIPAETPMIATGGIWTPAQADQVLAQGADLIGLGRVAIAHPDWPQKAVDPSWEPKRPPYSEEELRAAALGERLIQYMRAWPDFVASDDGGAVSS
jgi:2,4-dienoyl-CoA reductase-like NADH-dependent reductase (Old Yellow Enzyme family)